MPHKYLLSPRVKQKTSWQSARPFLTDSLLLLWLSLQGSHYKGSPFSSVNKPSTEPLHILLCASNAFPTALPLYSPSQLYFSLQYLTTPDIVSPTCQAVLSSPPPSTVCFACCCISMPQNTVWHCRCWVVEQCIQQPSTIRWGWKKQKRKKHIDPWATELYLVFWVHEVKDYLLFGLL